jgi:hypothetical protein
VAYSALLDANVLHPIIVCDLLLRFAEKGFFRPLCSREILDETTRSVARRFPHVSREALDRRVAAMESAFPDALVTGHEPLTRTLPFEDDAHVVAAAIVGGADVIVTNNLRHFPVPALVPYRLSAQSADDFLVHQWWLDPATGARVLVEQSAGTTRPHIPVPELLARLRSRLPGFVEVAEASPDLTPGGP